MNRVLDRLWIGSAEALRAPLRELDFRAVLDLRDGEHPVITTVVHKQIKNRDGDPWADKQVVEALYFINNMIKEGRVLVICAAGKSRSVSIVIGYLVKAGMDVASAWKLVKESRPEADPSPTMLASVLAAVHL